MIRLWISRKTATPIHDQLVGQFMLGILSQRLAPGERLPSVRALARRLQLHPNTISAVYRALGEGSWVTYRPGSGVFVRSSGSLNTEESVAAFAQSCFQEGLARGYAAELLRRAFARSAMETERDLLVIDPDCEFARILAAEVGESIGRTVPFSTYRAGEPSPSDTTCLLLTERFARTDPELFRRRTTRIIQLKSMQDVLLGYERPKLPILLSIVSRSEVILRWARTLVSALGFSPESVLFRNPKNEDWREGLHACHMIAADVISARELLGQPHVTEFRLVSREFLLQFSLMFSNQELR